MVGFCDELIDTLPGRCARLCFGYVPSLVDVTTYTGRIGVTQQRTPTMKFTKPALKQLTKTEIAEAVGCNFSTVVQQFVKECDKAGLINFILHTQGEGTFADGLAALAEKRPTQEKLDYSQRRGAALRDTFGDYRRDHNGAIRYAIVTDVDVYVVPSVWAEWADCLQFVAA